MAEHAEQLAALRRALHRGAERSNDERATAAQIADYLHAHDPQELLTGLAGHGVAARFAGRRDGPALLLRAELDALPIPESIALAHASESEGTSHKCGHDGHMAMLASLAPWLREQPPERGSVILLFQPAEETGEGAARLLAEPRFRALAPDQVFALHNLPGYRLGSVVCRDGVFAAGSRGLWVELEGATAHAAEPERGCSPALAVSQLIASLSALPQTAAAMHAAVKSTVIHVQVGEIAFGTTPGRARVLATLRGAEEDALERIGQDAVRLAEGLGAAHGLAVETRWTEVFPVTRNEPGAVALLRTVARECACDWHELELPFPWSEDVGHLVAAYGGALFGLGAGREQPALHHPTYDFPDALLPIGRRVWQALVRRATS